MIFRRFNGTGYQPITPTSRDTTANWLEKTGQPNLSPWTFSSTGAPTATSGTISGRIADGNGVAVAGAVVNLSGTQDPRRSRTRMEYSFAGVETTGLYTVRATRVNYSFSPQERSFSQLGNQTEAAFTAIATTITSNPVDTPEYFVRQHYLDFLGREPEEVVSTSGAIRYSDVARRACASEAHKCVGGLLPVDRVPGDGWTGRWTLSSKLTDGRRGSRSSCRNTRHRQRRSSGTRWLGSSSWRERQAFVDGLVQAAEFQAAYGDLSNEQYVDTLISHTGVASAAERDALVEWLIRHADASRGARQIAENRVSSARSATRRL